ncbi:hypothetical protein THERMOT_1144 [Bathymodiolus thermophilus thioautotrophic gill symbiont]|nr:hypothetical protein THERMOT_1144 [Bathymodiolus thermophilus thioautotrophic gill symbiont]
MLGVIPFSKNKPNEPSAHSYPKCWWHIIHFIFENGVTS